MNKEKSEKVMILVLVSFATLLTGLYLLNDDVVRNQFNKALPIDIMDFLAMVNGALFAILLNILITKRKFYVVGFIIAALILFVRWPTRIEVNTIDVIILLVCMVYVISIFLWIVYYLIKKVFIPAIIQILEDTQVMGSEKRYSLIYVPLITFIIGYLLK